MCIDLNADVGEGYDRDEPLMRLISSANVACGVHAGDAESMRETVALAVQHGVAVGAHPSFPDRENFGRREMHLGARELHECIVAQIETLANVAAAAGTRLRHVKPHGALYNMAARDEALAETVVRAVHRVDPGLIVFGLSGSVLLTVTERLGLRAVSEVFADRNYMSDGSLQPRHEPGSVIRLPAVVVGRALKMIREGGVRAVDGGWVAVRADTICVHGDTPGAAGLTKAVRLLLDAAGVTVAAP